MRSHLAKIGANGLESYDGILQECAAFLKDGHAPGDPSGSHGRAQDGNGFFPARQP